MSRHPREKSWRERHPFLWGMTQTFGIFAVPRPVQTVEESFQRAADAIADAIEETACPICLHLNRWYADEPVKAATHGAGGPDGSWSACYEHYKVITAFEWLGLTRNVMRPEGGRS